MHTKEHAATYYTGLAAQAQAHRNAKALQAGQAAREAVPAEWDDERLTDDEAQGEAEDQILSTSASVADCLAKLCDTPAGWLPVDVSTLTIGGRFMAGGQPAHVLLAVLLNGPNRDIYRAALALRDMLRRELADEIRDRKAEVIAADLAGVAE